MIVSDTGAIITLEKINGGFEFIKKLYGKIIIPYQVLDELSEGNQYKGNYLDFYKIRDLIDVRHSTLRDDLFNINLGDGEKYAISLAIEYGLPLLIEDREAKLLAIEKNILVSGIAGRVLKAFDSSVINKEEAEFLLKEIYDSNRINYKLYSLLLKKLCETNKS